MHIRSETPADAEEIYLLIKTAFETAEVKDGDEQDFAVRLRQSESYIPELALVAQQGSRLIGHMMLTRTCVREEGHCFEALLLAPLAVLLEYRGQRVAAKLIEEGFMRAREKGYQAVFLVGDPAYYHRFGFKSIRPYGIQPKTAIPDPYVMVCELVPGALKGVQGVLDCC